MPLFSDDALFESTGVRIAFTGRAGGVSAAPYDSLNLSIFVGDDQSAVEENRRSALTALGGEACALLVPKQVHGDRIACVCQNDEDGIQRARAEIEEGADGIIVAADNVAALLGFADCIPVIIVAPSGAFAVVHAGWRGVMNRIAPQALRKLADLTDQPPSTMNIYIGPHIHGECFETSADVHAQFTESFGEEVAFDATHIDLNKALRISLIHAGASPDRIADMDRCTVCDSDKFFSYRATGGTCGRHGAIAFKVSS